MAKVEPRIVRELVDQVENLERRIKGAGKMTSARLNSIDDVRSAVGGPAGSFDATRWTRLSADRQKDLLKRLNSIRNELLDASVMDTRGSNKQPERESRQSIIWLTVFAFIFAATLLSLIR